MCCTRAKDVKLVALFSPEHGIRGVLDEDVPSSEGRADRAAHPLAVRRHAPADRRRCSTGIDTLVIDLQDVGARFYTYPATMVYVMEEAATRKLEVVVLDRPNPINGWQIEGPVRSQAAVGFIAYLPAMPVRHGMTLGELARLFNAERKIGADADSRADEELAARRLVRSDRAAVDQSVAEHAQPDPGDALSRHRRDRIHQHLGGPRHRHAVRADRRAVDRRRRLAAALNARRLPGVRFYPVSFTPTSSKYAEERCQGVFMVVTNRVGAAAGAPRPGDGVGAVELYGEQYEMRTPTACSARPR